MNRDEDIRLGVMKEIKSERKVSNPDRIKINVKDGVVTLKYE